MGELERFEDEGGMLTDLELRLLSLIWRGRREDARAVLERFGQVSFGAPIGRMIASIRAYVEADEAPPARAPASPSRATSRASAAHRSRCSPIPRRCLS
jgi:hypothetical protein